MYTYHVEFDYNAKARFYFKSDRKLIWDNNANEVNDESGNLMMEPETDAIITMFYLTTSGEI